MEKVFKTKDDYYRWLSEDEENIQDTVDTLIEYVKQLQDENEDLSEYKYMYEDLCS